MVTPGSVLSTIVDGRQQTSLDGCSESLSRYVCIYTQNYPLNIHVGPNVEAMFLVWTPSSRNGPVIGIWCRSVEREQKIDCMRFYSCCSCGKRIPFKLSISLDRDRALYPYAALCRGGCNSLSASDVFEKMYRENYVCWLLLTVFQAILATPWYS